MIGHVDPKTSKLAFAAGIDLRGGYLDINDGRVRLFVKGKYPGAQPSGGYALRSRVVWWLRTGEVIRGNEFDIHHKNTNRSDDRFRNLEKTSHRDHKRLHHSDPDAMPKRKCKHCRKSFSINRWRLKEGSRGLFCSQKCYHQHPRSDDHKAAISEGMKAAYQHGRR